MKRKFISLVLGTSLVLASLTGCGIAGKQEDVNSDSSKTEVSEEEGRTEGKVELEFFNAKIEGETVFNKIIDLFQEENPDIIIKQTAPADAETVLFTRISTDDVPDIMSVYPAETVYHTMMEDGVYTELTDEEWLGRASDRALEFSSWDGKNFAMPFAMNSFGLYCNLDMFEENGLDLPKTWEDLMAVAEEFDSNGVTPFTFMDKDPGNLSQEAERVIGIIKNDINVDCEEVGTTDASFTSPDKPYFRQMAEAILATREYAEDTLSYSVDQSTVDFANGNFPMFAATTARYTAIMQNNPDLNFTLVPYPNPVGDNQSLPINIDIAYGVSSKTPYQEEAKKFIEFLSRPEIYQMVADEEGTPPVIEGVEYNIEPLQEIKDTIDNGQTFLTMVNFWPSGWRSEWSVYVQQLIADQDIDNLLKETDRISKEKYTQE